jgi:hypothetical protein
MLPPALFSPLFLVLAVRVLTPTPEFHAGRDDMHRIGIAYHHYCDFTGQPPANAEQLAPHLKNDRRLVNALKNKDIVFFYDVPMNGVAAAAGCSLTVLAYEKGAPTKGGWVVLFDGSARLLDPTEFKKSALPK